ncbi:MAG: DUF4118 domain-containing protein [Lachnospiraceae bacterium]|nr:DUF4118 domain-containing protein [Lachnospiraceae bacterium]
MTDPKKEKEEHILVCISPSPSNPKVVEAAAKLAEAFNATLTAVYIKPTGYESFQEADKERLKRNILFAESCGASVATIIGDDVSMQVAEYARLSLATKIVVGRSLAKRKHIFSKSLFTEQIIIQAPGVDVFIIPDSDADFKEQKERLHLGFTGRIKPTLKDTVMMLFILIAATAVGLMFTRFGFSEANIITVFILGVLVISVMTVSPVYGLISSLFSVLLFNWFFIDPRFSFHTYQTEYVVTFGIMLISSLITGSLANKLKMNARQSAREAFRATVLFDTNQMLQKAEKADDIVKITAHQIIRLLDRDVTVYARKEGGDLSDAIVYPPSHAPVQEKSETEISLNGYCYGVLSVDLKQEPLETFENSVFLSILGECALALDNLRNAEEKEKASMIARNEQLRSNLLRSISHDIRTPLTSISGNASNLLSHYRQLDDETLKQIFSDIYYDSEWLVNLVENLLSISRIENGQMQLHLAPDVVNDVIEESLKHVDRDIAKHQVVVENSDDILLVNMDTGLIMQVLINLINNAVKNTPLGSTIFIQSRREASSVIISVSDDGPGVPDEIRPHIFEMFYSGQNKVIDGRRGLGLGLALCKSIIEAHHGTIRYMDHQPRGSSFVIELPVEEVEFHE